MACVASLTLTSALAFGVGARKSVALTVNGETTTVTTYAMSVDRLLQEQGVKVKTHDLVESTSPTSMLKNHDVVNVQSAYQTTITIDGQEVPFWTVASSAEQLLDFFNQNETEAAKITVNISNVYNKLTGGLIINQKGPVTVIADGKSSMAPNGKLPAASILDAKGITLGKEDRVSVEKDGKTMDKMSDDIRRDLSYMTYAPILFISAATGQRVPRLFEMINYVHNQSCMRISTGMLNNILADAQTRVQPPTDRGRRLKIYYMTQVGVCPPHFVVFCNERKLFHFSYQRYLENCIRNVFGLEGTPVIMSIREKGDKEE